ncbi:MAG TPA: hypothetical protein VL133_00375, partial [Devosia sp.]|nr:hypothetical protein [Devosia sp.]
MTSTNAFGKRGRTVAKPQQAIRSSRDDVALSSERPEWMKLTIFGVAFSATMFVVACLIFWVMPPMQEPASQTASATKSTTLTSNELYAQRLRVAKEFCNGLNRQSVGTAPCEIGTSAITVYSNSTVSEARALCSQAIATMRRQGGFFGGQWTLYVKGPYSGAQSLAYCSLP